MLIPLDCRAMKDVMVPMRDGTSLAVDIYLPKDGQGPLPALLAMSPYGKNAQRQILPAPVTARVTDLCAEAGWTSDLLAAGYAHVIADTRGTGKSGGTFYRMYSEQESLDGYDLIEWIARQGWCDGNVGMLGISYFGTIQPVVASSRPPHLKAIAALEATTDQYLACYHGGVMDGFYSELPHGGMSNNTGSGMILRNPRSWSIENLPEAQWRARVAELQANPDIIQYNMFWSILDDPDRNTIFFDVALNPFRDSPYWWSPDLAKIDVPVLCGCAWYPDCGPKFVRGPTQLWQNVRGPRKMLMAPAGWLERPYSQFHEQLIRWFDHWLRGIDNGVMDEAPIQIWVNGAEQQRDEYEWPLARTRWTDYYLGTHRRLDRRVPRFADVEPDGYVQSPPLVSNELAGLTYSTGPQPSDLEVTGPVALYLHAALDATDGWFKATLLDIAPDGKVREITHGHLRCSHRALDTLRSTEHMPVHLHTRASHAPLVPGEINEYAIELYPVSHVFRKGHELAIRVSSGDLPGVGFSFHVMPGRTIAYRLYRDALRPSRLHLPVIPSADSTATSARFSS